MLIRWDLLTVRVDVCEMSFGASQNLDLRTAREANGARSRDTALHVRRRMFCDNAN
jgi:hypothetical protein